MPEAATKVKSSFFQHNMENERAPRVVTRSSAVFYFIQSESVNTQIHFMNYWKEKRGTQVSIKITLRGMDGTIAHEQPMVVDRQGGYVIEIAEILRAASLAVREGSVEVEIFAESNIAVAYPAAIVRYVGEDWHTVAHSSQRYFSETSGDDGEAVGAVREVEEGNLTIHADPRFEPFLIIHNGPVPVNGFAPQIEVRSADGRSMTVAAPPWDWAAFQTRKVMLADICDFRSFLAGGVGTFSIKFPIGGIFPRLIGGHQCGSQWSIDHTNFASITGPAAQDVIVSRGDRAFKELVFNLPNNVAENWTCFADLYPTYPDADYAVGMTIFDADGSANDAGEVHVGKGGQRGLVRIAMDNGRSGSGNLELSFRHGKQLPRRFHTGIHYQIGDGLPGFLTDGPLPHSTPPIRTRWFPVFDSDDARNYLLIANRFLGDDAPAEVVYKARLFNGFGDDPLESEIVLGAYESKCLGIADLFADAKAYLRGGTGWVYLGASEPQRAVLHYASVKGRDSIAVCHAF